MPDLVEEYREIAAKWESPLAFERLGWVLLESQREAAARTALNRAERMGRDSATIHYAQAFLDIRDNDLPKAMARLDRCLELDPTMHEARAKLAEILMQLGRYEQARQVIKGGQ